MDPIKPPSSLDPAALFLRLLEWPSPRAALKFRFDVAPDTELHVRAVPATTWLAAARSTDVAAVLASALCDASMRPLFASAAEFGRVVDRAEMVRLYTEASEQLDVISPHYCRADIVRWHATLTQGAEHCYSVAASMASCCDVAVGFGGAVRKPRPDLYWGCPVRDLLDGHHMAFRAAYDLVTSKNR